MRHTPIQILRPAMALALAVGLSPAAMAQTEPAGGQGCAGARAGAQDSATPPRGADSSGTDPGASGSTGWTGGTGGSFIGTSHDNATGAGDQPETATGLNPIDKPGNPAATGKGPC
ncbi:hypothetical protein [Ancylobacter lacus]|uniref:hypothetical protein n=1 Tax=Ancylobacter lacus TaxID=2579970 RepID=UPI001BCD94BA|nr:hypothetical protein [Ancylobacter lacus]MBS7537831.1 hypothetical protein [Ancylobacter lacus]